MDMPLAIEYSGIRKYFTYEMFKSLNYGESEGAIGKELEQSQEMQSDIIKQNPEEEEKGEENEDSSFEDSISSSNNNEDEQDSDYEPNDYASLRNEIKELRNDFKVCMEKIATPLNMIANYIMQNHLLKPEIPLIENEG